MACNCIKKVNNELRLSGTNTQLDIPLLLDYEARVIASSVCQISARKIDDRKREPAKIILATYCPFCGKKYEEKRKAR